MALYLVLLSTILAFSLTSTEQYVSPPGSNINLSLDSMKNASGHWITRIDTQQYTKRENTQPLSVNVQQGTSNKTEQLARPSLYDTSMSGAVQPTAASTSTSTSTATTPSSTTTTMTTTTNTSTTITTTTTTTTTIITHSTATTNTSITNSTTSSNTNTSSATTTTITITTTPDITITSTTTITTTTNTTTPKSCPNSGYQPYPGLNCYKAFPSAGERKTWSKARATCTADGGDLMVIETERERKEVYIPLYKSVSFILTPWVGVYIPQGGNDWTTVKGETALSTWWAPGEPDNNAARKCAAAYSTGLLVNYNCADTRSFICEISL